MTYAQGDVVVATDPFGYAPERPYLVVSNRTHPFSDEEAVVEAVTTTARDEAVPLSDGYERGGLPKESFVSPWALMTLKHAAVSKRVAVVTEDVRRRVRDAAVGYLSVDD